LTPASAPSTEDPRPAPGEWAIRTIGQKPKEPNCPHWRPTDWPEIQSARCPKFLPTQPDAHAPQATFASLRVRAPGASAEPPLCPQRAALQGSRPSDPGPPLTSVPSLGMGCGPVQRFWKSRLLLENGTRGSSHVGTESPAGPPAHVGVLCLSQD
uniref:Uncharacterized protein n=1 Tax=Sus scrofa TaxID=9823 RepID=A0A8D1GKJ6_PIG